MSLRPMKEAFAPVLQLIREPNAHVEYLRQLGVLVFLADVPGSVSLIKIAGELGIPRPAACRLASGLVTLGLAERDPGKGPRYVTYRISLKGRALLELAVSSEPTSRL